MGVITMKQEVLSHSDNETLIIQPSALTGESSCRSKAGSITINANKLNIGIFGHK